MNKNNPLKNVQFVPASHKCLAQTLVPGHRNNILNQSWMNDIIVDLQVYYMYHIAYMYIKSSQKTR